MADGGAGVRMEAEPGWRATLQEPDVAAGAEPRFAGERVDVAIVGGGYTGLSTALHCAEAGLEAQVIEAGSLGRGASGRNVGLVNAGVWLPPSAVLSALGDDVGGRFLELFGRGPDIVFDLIERHQIRCHAARVGTLHAAHAPSGVRDLAKRRDAWRALGAPVTLLSREEAVERIGSPAFFGALLDRRAGVINPLGYCRGLARAAQAAGARISAGVRATALHRAASGWRISTSAGELAADAVVLASGAYAGDLWPALRRGAITIRYFQLATEPLGDRAAAILPGGQGLWNTAPIMTSLRKDADGRLIVGSMGALMGDARRGASRAWAARRLARMFPDLGPVRFEAAWDGPIAMTSDHLPKLLKLDEGVYAPFGYNGRGVTTGTIFGRSLAALLTGGDPADATPPVAPLQPERAGPAWERLYGAAFAANQILRGG